MRKKCVHTVLDEYIIENCIWEHLPKCNLPRIVIIGPTIYLDWEFLLDPQCTHTVRDISSPGEHTIATEHDIMCIKKLFIGCIKSFLQLRWVHFYIYLSLSAFIVASSICHCRDIYMVGSYILSVLLNIAILFFWLSQRIVIFVSFLSFHLQDFFLYCNQSFETRASVARFFLIIICS